MDQRKRNDGTKQRFSKLQKRRTRIGEIGVVQGVEKHETETGNKKQEMRTEKKKREKRKGSCRGHQEGGRSIDSCSSGISEDRELTTGTSPVELAVTSGSVIDLGSHLNVILGALSSLIGGGEAPRPSTTIGVNGERVVGSGGNNDSIDTGNLSGFNQDARASPGILDDRIIRERVDLQATLVTIHATPDQAFAIDGAGNGVVSATADLGDAPVGERLDGDGVGDGGFIVTGIVADAGCAETVQAPGVDRAVGVDGERVVGAGAYVHNVLAQAELARLQAVQLVALDDAAAELVLLTRTPGEDTAPVVEGEDVVGTTGELLDLLEGRDQDGSGLNPVLRIKPKDAIIALMKNEANVISIVNTD